MVIISSIVMRFIFDSRVITLNGEITGQSPTGVEEMNIWATLKEAALLKGHEVWSSMKSAPTFIPCPADGACINSLLF